MDSILVEMVLIQSKQLPYQIIINRSILVLLKVNWYLISAKIWGENL